MKHSIIISIISIILTAGLSATEVPQKPLRLPSGIIAKNLVSQFDLDKTDGLNALELSGAVGFLKAEHPFFSSSLDYTSTSGEESAPPRVAVGLVEGFDSDSDVQLTEEELTLAITYLRRLERGNRGLVALAE